MSTRDAWKGPAYGAVAAGLIALLIIVMALWSVVVALTTPSPESSVFDLTSLDARVESHERMYENRLLAQLDGRSMFYVPPRPPPPPPPPRPVETTRDDSPPPAPTRYGGPKLVAIFYDQAWFDNGERVSIGEESRGVEVVELTPPWSARVLWRGAEFTIELFEKDKVVLPEQP